MIPPASSFAATFNELFADIFDRRPPKPRIRKLGPMCWEAAGGGVSRVGIAPVWAYRAWRSAWREANPMEQKATA